MELVGSDLGSEADELFTAQLRCFGVSGSYLIGSGVIDIEPFASGVSVICSPDTGIFVGAGGHKMSSPFGRVIGDGPGFGSGGGGWGITAYSVAVGVGHITVGSLPFQLVTLGVIGLDIAVGIILGAGPLGLAGTGDGVHGNGVGAVDTDGGVDIQLDGDDVVVDDIGAEQVIGGMEGGERTDIVGEDAGAMEIPFIGVVVLGIDIVSSSVDSSGGSDGDGDGIGEDHVLSGDTEPDGADDRLVVVMVLGSFILDGEVEEIERVIVLLGHDGRIGNGE